jgi:hypothetical protein
VDALDVVTHAPGRGHARRRARGEGRVKGVIRLLDARAPVKAPALDLVAQLRRGRVVLGLDRRLELRLERRDRDAAVGQRLGVERGARRTRGGGARRAVRAAAGGGKGVRGRKLVVQKYK